MSFWMAIMPADPESADLGRPGRLAHLEGAQDLVTGPLHLRGVRPRVLTVDLVESRAAEGEGERAPDGDSRGGLSCAPELQRRHPADRDLLRARLQDPSVLFEPAPYHPHDGRDEGAELRPRNPRVQRRADS